MKILVTGGAGFIGSAVCRHLINATDHHVVNLDKLTYAANLASLAPIADNSRYSFVKLDICDGAGVAELLVAENVDAIMHLAAESHVDRSISGPADFIETNIIGTYSLLEAARNYWSGLSGQARDLFRFHHISTDEVYGDLPLDDSLFTEKSPYDPSSPYSASKAASDHLARAWHRTYGLPVVLSNCSNNYGPRQFPEKLIPLMIVNALEEKPLPVYGRGENVRDWLYVDDHARALVEVITRGQPGEAYNIGGNSEQTNLTVVKQICTLMDELHPRRGGKAHSELIEYVPDRPGHDLRYAIDARKIKNELGWAPSESFDTGLHKTAAWYLANEAWWRPIRDGRYSGDRMGLIKSA